MSEGNRPGRDQFRVVYPGGDRTKLAVADIWSYEADEYALASRKIFYDEHAANKYARKLAHDNKLKFEGGAADHDYLD
jgi:hypothetical protein